MGRFFRLLREILGAFIVFKNRDRENKFLYGKAG